MIISSAVALVMALQNERYDPPSRGDDIQLVCYGQAQKPTVESHSGYQWNPDTHKYEQKSTIESGKTSFDTAVNISIQGPAGQIHMPPQLIPPIHSGDSKGWWDIEDLVVGHDEIRGHFRLNGMNKPSLVINRHSGVITIDGLIKFSGRCDPDDGHRRF